MTSRSRKLRSELGNALMESVSLRERRRRNVVEREREGGGRFLQKCYPNSRRERIPSH